MAGHSLVYTIPRAIPQKKRKTGLVHLVTVMRDFRM
jgi:hypothetical protein